MRKIGLGEDGHKLENRCQKFKESEEQCKKVGFGEKLLGKCLVQ